MLDGRKLYNRIRRRKKPDPALVELARIVADLEESVRPAVSAEAQRRRDRLMYGDPYV